MALERGVAIAQQVAMGNPSWPEALVEAGILNLLMRVAPAAGDAGIRNSIGEYKNVL